MDARIETAGRTDRGMRRNTNEDHFLIADLAKSMNVRATSLSLDCPVRVYGTPQAKVLLVADGMGGHEGGRRASTLAIDFVINHLLNDIHWPQGSASDIEKFELDLQKMLLGAHEMIERSSHSENQVHNMGTTFTMAYILWPQLVVVHAGDSRCYLLREKKFEQLTRDHTMADKMVADGDLNAQEAARSRWGDVLWNALGGGVSQLVAEVSQRTLQDGDRLLLCTDGLNKHVNDQEIADIITVDNDPGSACRALIELANYRGGYDNTTVIVARCDPPGPRIPRASVATQVTLERLLSDITGPPTTIPPDQPLADTIEHL